MLVLHRNDLFKTLRLKKFDKKLFFLTRSSLENLEPRTSQKILSKLLSLGILYSCSVVQCPNL